MAGLKRAFDEIRRQKLNRAFKKKCEKASALSGANVSFFDDGSKSEREEFEDDGYLHIRRNGLRACFEIDPSQDDPVKHNKMMKAVYVALRLEKSMPSRFLADTACPGCGRPF